MKNMIKKNTVRAAEFRKKVKNVIKRDKWIVSMFLSFYILDITTLTINNINNFFSFSSLVTLIFSCLWIGLIIGICFCLPKKKSRFFYMVIISIFLVLFLTNNIYYIFYNTFFDFSVLEYTSEATPYLTKSLLSIKPWIILVLVLDIAIIIWTIKRMNYSGKIKFKLLFKIIILFLVGHYISPTLLGFSSKELEWDAWRNKRNIYNTFSDANKSMTVSGFYEYSFRNFYITYLKQDDKISNENLALLEEKFVDPNESYNNNYTGMFEGKNLIVLQMEGVDDFLLNKDIMPYTYNIMTKSINFNNHYSFVSGGGSTFNSEFMVNTGYSTPYTYNQNAYTFSKNNFDYSLPNIFKSSGYNVNAFHMNTKEYYSRGVNYNNFGYKKFYSLKSQSYYKDNSYILDTELINNPEFNQNIFNTEQKFMDYIITYSVHMPFESEKGVCKKILSKIESQNESLEEENVSAEVEKKKYSEEECLHIAAKETDDMVKLLFENLENKGLLDNTVVVFFADHYLYTLEDKTILDKYKNTTGNLINKTPFFIWSNDVKPQTITKLNSQLNILPTVLNMFNLYSHPNYYLLQDIFANNYKELVFFSDMSWYDGKRLVKDEDILWGEPIDYEYIQHTNYDMYNLVKINDSVLKSDYFRKIK